MIGLAQRVKGGYKNRITAERNKSAELEEKLSLHQEYQNAIKVDIDYLSTLFIAIVASWIFLPFVIGLDFSTVVKTSLFILLAWCLPRIFKTSRIKVRLNEMEENRK
ncbi:MAG: hypothetical protein K0R18_95 [Bacillales bacterium]|jgi:hypothetical protein|nr:hypothetical protein [Bacillales bacterium]